MERARLKVGRVLGPVVPHFHFPTTSPNNFWHFYPNHLIFIFSNLSPSPFKIHHHPPKNSPQWITFPSLPGSHGDDSQLHGSPHRSWSLWCQPNEGIKSTPSKAIPKPFFSITCHSLIFTSCNTPFSLQTLFTFHNDLFHFHFLPRCRSLSRPLNG